MRLKVVLISRYLLSVIYLEKDFRSEELLAPHDYHVSVRKPDALLGVVLLYRALQQGGHSTPHLGDTYLVN
jgi:hypothetical protein